MDEQIKLFLNNVQELPGYAAFEELVANSRPRVPLYNFRESNQEEWKVKSGRQQGYDLFASLLNIKLED
jgi:hypothetical protein